jgi:uncharacterized protein YgiM (DUF1202 family)
MKKLFVIIMLLNIIGVSVYASGNREVKGAVSISYLAEESNRQSQTSKSQNWSCYTIVSVAEDKASVTWKSSDYGYVVDVVAFGVTSIEDTLLGGHRGLVLPSSLKTIGKVNSYNLWYITLGAGLKFSDNSNYSGLPSKLKTTYINNERKAGTYVLKGRDADNGQWVYDVRRNVAIGNGRYAYVNADAINVRSGPSADYKIVISLSRNSRVEIIDSSGRWWKIKSGDKEGYVNSSYLRN